VIEYKAVAQVYMKRNDWNNSYSRFKNWSGRKIPQGL